MENYLIEFSTPYKRGGDDENNAIRECAARNGLQVGNFNSKNSLIELAGKGLKPGWLFMFRDFQFRILA